MLEKYAGTSFKQFCRNANYDEKNQNITAAREMNTISRQVFIEGDPAYQIYQFREQHFESCYKANLNEILRSCDQLFTVKQVSELEAELKKLDEKLNAISHLPRSVKEYLNNMLRACVSESLLETKKVLFLKFNALICLLKSHNQRY